MPSTRLSQCPVDSLKHQKIIDKLNKKKEELETQKKAPIIRVEQKQEKAKTARQENRAKSTEERGVTFSDSVTYIPDNKNCCLPDFRYCLPGLF